MTLTARTAAALVFVGATVLVALGRLDVTTWLALSAGLAVPSPIEPRRPKVPSRGR